MGYLVAHCEKYQAGSVGAVERHEERLNENYGNKDIDKSRIKDNFYPVELEHSGKYSQRIKAIFASYDIKPWDSEKRTGYKSNSVVMAGWIIGASPELFKDLDPARVQEYFRLCTEFIAEKIGGKDKLINAVVHMDEKTPHLHLSYVPILPAKDNNGYRLSCKDLHSRKFLKAVQDELPKFLKAHGFNIERGLDGSEAKHKKPQEFKKEQAQQQEELKPVLEAVKGLEAGEHTREGLFHNGAEVVKVPVKVFNQVKAQLENYGAVLQEVLKLQAQIARQTKLREQKAHYKAEAEELKKALAGVHERLKESQQLADQRQQEAKEAHSKGVEAGKAEARQELELSILQVKELFTTAEKEKAEATKIREYWQSAVDRLKARSNSLDRVEAIGAKLALYGAVDKWLEDGSNLAEACQREMKRQKQKTHSNGYSR